MGIYRSQGWTKIRLCNSVQVKEDKKVKLDLFLQPSHEEGFLEVGHVFDNSYSRGDNTAGFFDDLLSVVMAREFHDEIQDILYLNPLYRENFGI